MGIGSWEMLLPITASSVGCGFMISKKEADPGLRVGLTGLRNSLSFSYLDFYPSVLGPALGSLVRGYRLRLMGFDASDSSAARREEMGGGSCVAAGRQFPEFLL